mmetsp:Transcript_9346/g.33041  ORF Transcript_9346/g.33041 Transcript_9346/m.33041 type:complete len:247 (+) Transcript_9346:2462-3202(+)
MSLHQIPAHAQQCRRFVRAAADFLEGSLKNSAPPLLVLRSPTPDVHVADVSRTVRAPDRLCYSRSAAHFVERSPQLVAPPSPLRKQLVLSMSALSLLCLPLRPAPSFVKTPLQILSLGSISACLPPPSHPCSARMRVLAVRSEPWPPCLHKPQSAGSRALRGSHRGRAPRCHQSPSSVDFAVTSQCHLSADFVHRTGWARSSVASLCRLPPRAPDCCCHRAHGRVAMPLRLRTWTCPPSTKLRSAD